MFNYGFQWFLFKKELTQLFFDLSMKYLPQVSAAVYFVTLGLLAIVQYNPF